MVKTLLKVGIVLGLLAVASCKKTEESTTKVKAPLRNYIITARLDNKQAGTDSKATGVLKGSYSETTKVLSYTLTYESLDPMNIRIDKGAKGSVGTQVSVLDKNMSQGYSSPLDGYKKLSSLEERDMLKGLWYVSIESVTYRPYEIRGAVTVKLK